MKGIKKFEVDCARLRPGVYIFQRSHSTTTLDLRFVRPNHGVYLPSPAMHTIEHLGATFLRNHPEFADKTVYFGPMGCRTGFYMLLAGDYSSREIAPLVTEMFEFIRDFRGEIPGAAPRDCGNWQDQNLNMANWLAERYLTSTLIGIDEKHLIYPE